MRALFFKTGLKRRHEQVWCNCPARLLTLLILFGSVLSSTTADAQNQGQQTCCDNVQTYREKFRNVVEDLKRNIPECDLDPAKETQKWESWLEARRAPGGNCPGTSGCVSSLFAAPELAWRITEIALRCATVHVATPPTIVIKKDTVETTESKVSPPIKPTCICCDKCAKPGEKPITGQIPERHIPEIQAEMAIGVSVMRVKRPGSPVVSMAELPLVLDPTGGSIAASVSVSPWRAVRATSEYLTRSSIQVADAGTGRRSDAPANQQIIYLHESFDHLPTFLKTMSMSIAGAKNIESNQAGFALALSTDLWNHRDPRMEPAMAQCLLTSYEAWRRQDAKDRPRTPDPTECENKHFDAFGAGIRAGFLGADPPQLENIHGWLSWDFELNSAAVTGYVDFGSEPIVDDERHLSGRLGARLTLGSSAASLSLQAALGTVIANDTPYVAGVDLLRQRDLQRSRRVTGPG